MKKGINIIKNVWTWIIIAVCLVICSWLVFWKNVRYSEEFTSWVSVSIQWDYSSEENMADIESFLKANGYEDTNIYVDLEDDVTTIKIQTKMDNDTEVSELSTNFKQYLIEKNVIESEEDIVQQKITWPSVWSYMKKTTLSALIIWLIFIVIYLLISFASIRNYVSPTSLWLIVIITMIFDISLP